MSENWSAPLSLSLSLQSVSGLRLTDTFLKRTYEYDDIAQVCVVSSAVQVEAWRKFPMLDFLLITELLSVFCQLCEMISSNNKYMLFKFVFCKTVKY